MPDKISAHVVVGGGGETTSDVYTRDIGWLRQKRRRRIGEKSPLSPGVRIMMIKMMTRIENFSRSGFAAAAAAQSDFNFPFRDLFVVVGVVGSGGANANTTREVQSTQ